MGKKAFGEDAFRLEVARKFFPLPESLRRRTPPEINLPREFPAGARRLPRG